MMSMPQRDFFLFLYLTLYSSRDGAARNEFLGLYSYNEVQGHAYSLHFFFPATYSKENKNQLNITGIKPNPIAQQVSEP